MPSAFADDTPYVIIEPAVSASGLALGACVRACVRLFGLEESRRGEQEHRREEMSEQAVDPGEADIEAA